MEPTNTSNPSASSPTHPSASSNDTPVPSNLRSHLRQRQQLAPPLPPPDPQTQRLSLPFPRRLLYATFASTFTGTLLGTSHGAQTSALRFRAENSHRLPTSERGWYLYHKSKNYYVAVQSVKEGARMAVKLGVWTGVFFALEEVLDRGRVGRAYFSGDEAFRRVDQRRVKDCLSTVTAGTATAGVFGVWYRLPWVTAARTVKVGFASGLMLGLSQDALTELGGQRLGYVDWVRKVTGLRLGVGEDAT